MNVSTNAIELTGVRFTAGILFNFPTGSALAPGERVVVVRNKAAFAARYGNTPVGAGEYEGNLSNSGEEIGLTDATGQDIRRFQFLDRSPWPSSANMNGYSLVLQRPNSRPDHRDPNQWRASVRPGGSPGESDTSVFVGNPTADANANGQADLLDYAFGAVLTDPITGVALSLESRETNGQVTQYLVLTFPRNLAADDVVVTLETAADLSGPWLARTGDFLLLRELRSAAGPVRQSFQMTAPTTAGSAFVRLSVSLAP